MNFWPSDFEEFLPSVLTDLVRIDTTNPPGRETAAALYLQEILSREGVESRIIEKVPGRGNLIAELPGKGGSPILLISHLDVVGADPAEWKENPFGAALKGEKIWGRGTLDTKHLTVMELGAFVLLARSLKRGKTGSLRRPVLFIASADEEQGSQYGIPFVLENLNRDFRDADVISEGGGFPVKLGNKTLLACAAGEKWFFTYKITVRGAGGNYLFPPQNSAMLKMASFLEALADFKFPAIHCEIYDTFCGIIKEEEADQVLKRLSEYMEKPAFKIDSLLLDSWGETAPEELTLEVKLTIPPGKYAERLASSKGRDLLEPFFQGLPVEWELVRAEKGYQSSKEEELYKVLVKNSVELSGGEIQGAIPFVALGRTDGRFFGEQGARVYGFSPLLPEIPFSEVLSKVHQKDECIPLKSFLFGCKVLCKTLGEICLKDFEKEIEMNNFGEKKRYFEKAAGIMKKEKIDLWLLPIREGSDPIIPLLSGVRTVGLAAYCLFANGERIALASVIDAQDLEGCGFFNKVVKYQDSFEEALLSILEPEKPKRIAFNYSRDRYLFDGISLGLYRRVTGALSPLKAEYVSAEPILVKLFPNR